MVTAGRMERLLALLVLVGVRLMHCVDFMRLILFHDHIVDKLIGQLAKDFKG